MSIQLESVVQKAESMLDANVGDEMVIFDHADGKYFSTGAVGADILRFIDGETKVSDLVAHMSSSYDAEKAVLEAEVLAFLEKLRDHGLITVK